MKIVLTGAYGFLGWHVRVRLRAHTDHQVVALGRSDMERIDSELEDADAVIHVAGVNRGTDEEVEHGNVRLAQAVSHAVRKSPKVSRLSFANSIQTGVDSPYGRGKAQAGILLADSAAQIGARFVDVVLPNLFGEHGRPDYNSFVATFVRAVVEGREPVIRDRDVELLHVQRAAEQLISAVETPTTDLVRPKGDDTSVLKVWESLQESHRIYESGEIPPLVGELDVELFNTLRAAMFPGTYPIMSKPNRDGRGSLVECVRSHRAGQSFVSTSVPGVTRGEHFHLGKVERFLVVRGQARIALRRLFHDEVICFDVRGDEPAIVDMPTMWAHNITNTGDDELVTFFWTHTLFDPLAPDTYPEPVTSAEGTP